MSQYGKAEYWEERYTRYNPCYDNIEILSLLIGIKDLQGSKI